MALWTKLDLKRQLNFDLKKHATGRRKILNRHFDFYKSLPPVSKQIFEHRVGRFIQLTDFIPRQMSQITEEMKVLISASAVQITFGFDDVLLDHFSKIIVYPDQFFSSSDQRSHRGEVNPGLGIIVLSWRHFAEGYAQKEGRNLGLHEMAHALYLENFITNQEYGFMKEVDLEEWDALAKQEMTNGNFSIFREYGSTNPHEFFAVAVENFFERPEAFKSYNPHLYKALCQLLKQDPTILKQA